MESVYQIYPGRRKLISGQSLTIKLIIINVVFYFLSLILISFFGGKFFAEQLALMPSMVLSGKSLWTFLTSMFMHSPGSFFHIFANMFSLFFIGSFLEKIIGKKRFFWVYMISGLAGGLFFVLSGLIFNELNIPAVGASGAIFGILGVLAVLVPYSKIYLIAGPLILIVLQVVFSAILPPGLAGTFSMIINILIIASIFAMFSFNPRIKRWAFPIELHMWIVPIIAIVPLVIIGFFISLPIGNSAHIGGLVVGLIYGFYLREKFPRKTDSLSRHFS